MLREIAAMANMIHPNIVRLYGIITEESVTPWLVLEYLPYGDLKSYLSVSYIMYMYLYFYIYIYMYRVLYMLVHSLVK